ncbi:MAG: choice-of-anchor D domain-containing protein, partial [Chitinophagales bacterium]
MKKIAFIVHRNNMNNTFSKELFPSLKSIIIIFFCLFTFSNELAAQTIQLRACTNLLDCAADINLVQNGTSPDGGVTRNTYTTSPNPNCPGASQITPMRVIWDTVQDRWEIQMNGDTGNPDYEIDLYFSSSTFAPNPPDMASGSWTVVPDNGPPSNDTGGEFCSNGVTKIEGTGTQNSGGNTAPTITIDDLQYTQGQNSGNPVQIDGSAAASDTEENWDGGSLTVEITANEEPGDEISVSQTGITISGTSIEEGGITFASISETSGTVNDGIVTNGDELTVNFNGNATNARVQALVRAIVYRSTAGTPGTSDRTVTYILSDDTEGTTETPLISIIVIPELDVRNNADDTDIADGEVAGNISSAKGTDYGSVNVGSNSSNTFRAKNNGGATLTFTADALSISNTTDFSITTDLTNSGTVAASGVETFTIRFNPGSTGTKTCTVTINSDDSNENPYTFAIQGVGTAPELDVRNNADDTDIADGEVAGDISSSKGTDYGNVNVGSNSSNTFRAKNNGTGVLTFTADALS